MASKSTLAVALSRLKLFSKPKIKLEQYPTDSEVAAGMLWNLNMLGDLEDAVIIDIGCGTGVLGIGALLLGAKKVYFIDTDKSALAIAKENIDDLDLEYDNNIKFIESDVKQINPNMFKENVDLVIQNPPFGTNETHADKVFLEKAFSIAGKVVSFHKESTKKFVEAISKTHKFSITHHWRFKFPLKKTQDFHKKKIQYIDVGCWRFEKS